MRRRGFIQLLSAAIAAPALPAVAAPAAATSSYSRYTFGMAVFHARTRAHVSAAGISYRLKVPLAEAEAMIAEMASKGMVTPVLSKPGAVRATSNILKPGVWDTSEVQKAARARRKLQAKAKSVEQSSTAAETPAWIAHVRSICVQQGLALHPRCMA